MADENMQKSTLVKLDILMHLNLANFYPAMMHQATRATETVVQRIGQVADALKQNKKTMVLRSTESCSKSLFEQL